MNLGVAATESKASAKLGNSDGTGACRNLEFVVNGLLARVVGVSDDEEGRSRFVASEQGSHG